MGVVVVRLDIVCRPNRGSVQTLLEMAGQAKAQRNPGAVVAAIRQLDWMCGLGINSHAGHRVHRSRL